MIILGLAIFLVYYTECFVYQLFDFALQGTLGYSANCLAFSSEVKYPFKRYCSLRKGNLKKWSDQYLFFQILDYSLSAKLFPESMLFLILVLFWPKRHRHKLEIAWFFWDLCALVKDSLLAVLCNILPQFQVIAVSVPNLPVGVVVISLPDLLNNILCNCGCAKSKYDFLISYKSPFKCLVKID